MLGRVALVELVKAAKELEVELMRSYFRTRRHGWRWWRWENHYGGRRPFHARPHIGLRRARRILDTGPEWSFTGRRSAAGRPLAFQKPPYMLHLDTVLAGPYEENYAGYRAAWWWQRLVMRSRARRGWPRSRQYQRLYRSHPLQGGKQ